MKVVFLQDVTNVAKAGEVKEVADGYARNYLLRRKLAVLATPGALSNVETELKIRVRSAAENEARLVELANQLEGKEVVLKSKAGAKEHLYGSITAADIAAGLERQGLVVDKRKIELAEPIRELGTHEVPIKLAREITPRVKVTVVRLEE